MAKERRKRYVQLCKATEMWPEDARWQANAKAWCTDGKNEGYIIAGEDTDEITALFYAADLEETAYKMFDFMGSPGEDERFYVRPETLYKDAKGVVWVKYNENLFYC